MLRSIEPPSERGWLEIAGRPEALELGGRRVQNSAHPVCPLSEAAASKEIDSFKPFFPRLKFPGKTSMDHRPQIPTCKIFGGKKSRDWISLRRRVSLQANKRSPGSLT